jgi:hypothetical protein
MADVAAVLSMGGMIANKFRILAATSMASLPRMNKPG